MLTRIAVFLGVLGLGAFIFFLNMPTKSNVIVTDARAVPMGSSGTMFMVTLKMQNEGDAVALVGASSPSGAEVSITNPSQNGPLVVPAGGVGLLAMDGAHMMLSVPDGEFEEGAYQSISLSFEDGSTVASRVLRPKQDEGTPKMDHGMSNGVEVSPLPAISFTSPPTHSAQGLSAEISLENFEFVRAAAGAQHVANKGHAHIYLNGLKLGRLYDNKLEIGALAPGTYVLRVSLNTNDHRPYVVNGKPIEAVAQIEIP